MEYRFPGGEPWMINEVFQPKGGPVDRYSINQFNAMFMNVIVWPLYLVPVFFPEHVWLGLAPVLLGMVAQFVIHAIITNIKLKNIYNPGLTAVVLGHVPLGIWYLTEVYRQDLIHSSAWVGGIVLMAFYVGIIMRMIGYGLLAHRNSQYPFDADEIMRWSRERRLHHAGITPAAYAVLDRTVIIEKNKP